ncbi:3-oxoacyl-ACP reductase FabG [Nocardiopsis coralliicola]
MARRVLVSGGNRGIGLAIARRFAGAGEVVAVTYRSGPPPDGLAAIPCDVTEEGAVEGALRTFEERFGSVEILVANAGITQDGLILRMPDAAFERVLDTNLTGAFRLARRVSAAMAKRRWGRLIFISSVSGHLGAPGQANYAAAKAGMVGMARSLAWELGPRGVTANVVCPGLIETEMSHALSGARRDHLLGATPLGHAGTPEDVASVVGFLGSEEARYVTGAVVPVSGGLGMGH